MKRSDLVELLNALPDVEVGDMEGMISSVELSDYNDENGTHPYIHLEFTD
jgi:hypothetical protein